MNDDIISRSALKKEIENLIGYSLSYEAILNAIDNAPTVPLPDFKDGYKQAIIDGKTNFSRPQGEWIANMTTGDIFCSCCKESRRDTRINHINFCPSCGADMRKGVRENDSKRSN